MISFQRSAIAAAGLAMLAMIPAQAKTFVLKTFDAPGATGTQVLGINNNGDMSGTWIDASSVSHGFFRTAAGVFTSIDFAGAVHTQCQDLNDSDDVVCSYRGTDGNVHAFLYQLGVFTSLPDFSTGADNATVSSPQGISAISEITGFYTFDPAQVSGYHGFLMSNNNYAATVNVPDPGNGVTTTNTYASAVNKPGVVGGYFTTSSGGVHGFTRATNGTYAQVDFPFSQQSSVLGLNKSGHQVGSFVDAKGVHGFYAAGSAFSRVNPPKSVSTWTASINDSDSIAGYYKDSSGKMHGFSGAPR